jgi:lactam utilization protein B
MSILCCNSNTCFVIPGPSATPVNPQSICVHGDNAEAVATAQALPDGLGKAGFSVVTVPEL